MVSWIKVDYYSYLKKLSGISDIRYGIDFDGKRSAVECLRANKGFRQSKIKFRREY